MRITRKMTVNKTVIFIFSLFLGTNFGSNEITSKNNAILEIKENTFKWKPDTSSLWWSSELIRSSRRSWTRMSMLWTRYSFETAGRRNNLKVKKNSIQVSWRLLELPSSCAVVRARNCVGFCWATTFAVLLEVVDSSSS